MKVCPRVVWTVASTTMGEDEGAEEARGDGGLCILEGR